MGTDPDIGGSKTQTKRNYHSRNHTQDTSQRTGAHRATHTGSPTQSSTTETNITGTVGSHPGTGIHSKPVGMRKSYTPIFNQTPDTRAEKNSKNHKMIKTPPTPIIQVHKPPVKQIRDQPNRTQRTPPFKKNHNIYQPRQQIKAIPIRKK